MTTTIVFLVILNFILSIILVYSINKLQNSASLTTPASTTSASTTTARTTPASTTASITASSLTTPASTTVASTTWASLTTPASTTSASTTTARTTPAVLLDNFHSTSCASPIDRETILDKVDEAISRMNYIRDNINGLRGTKPLSDVEYAFVMEFINKSADTETITTKILREYFTTCRLEYRYTIIIEPNLSGNVFPFDDELKQMKINIYDATNAWYKPFIDLGLFPGHDHVNCICVEAIFKKDKHRLLSTEGVYISDQGDQRSSSIDNNALWWKKYGTFNAFHEYESYIQTKCPEESFIACRDAHSMQEITYHTSKYKEQSTAGTIYTDHLSNKNFLIGQVTRRYSRFVKNAILRDNRLSLINHEFGHSLFGMRDSLSDGGTNYNDIQYSQAQLKSINPNTTCYGMGRGCLEIGKTDIHCAAHVMLETLKHMKSQNGWIDGYMRR